MPNKTETSIRETVQGLFEKGLIQYFIGYEKGSLGSGCRPVVISSAEDVNRLVWNAFCTLNLAAFLPRFFPRLKPQKGEKPKTPVVGILAKGCDSRSVVNLINEHQIRRENVYILGVPCPGLVDIQKVNDALGRATLERIEISSDGNSVHAVSKSGDEKNIDRSSVTQDACLECILPTPVIHDQMIEGNARPAAGGDFQTVSAFAGKPLGERWRYFEAELAKCIRCNACRQACPNCYCQTCFADQTKPQWVGPGIEASDVMVYHIGRILHQAGRCVSCDACAQACPMGIDLRTLTQKMVQEVKQMFDHAAGMSLGSVPPMCEFRADDPETFIAEA